MAQYIVRRFIYMILLLILSSMVVYILIELPPGDWITNYIHFLERFGYEVDEAFVDKLQERWGFRDPVYVQYFKWFTNIVIRGDFGESAVYQMPVADLIGERIALSMALSFSTFIFSTLIVWPVAIYVSTHAYTGTDYTVTVFGFLGLATPNFLLALILMFLLQRYLGWSPGGLFSPDYVAAPWSFAKVIDLIKHMPVPIFVIGTAGTAGGIRSLRAVIMDELGKQYVVTARAKGVGELRLLFKYPIRLALNPWASGVGGFFVGLISGEALTSIVLSLPTVGPLMLTSLLQQDLQLAASLLLFTFALGLIGTLMSDLILVLVDPRIRFEKRQT